MQHAHRGGKGSSLHPAAAIHIHLHKQMLAGGHLAGWYVPCRSLLPACPLSRNGKRAALLACEHTIHGGVDVHVWVLAVVGVRVHVVHKARRGVPCKVRVVFRNAHLG